MCGVNKANTFWTTKKWLKTRFAIYFSFLFSILFLGWKIKGERITSLLYIYNPIVFHL